MRPTISLISLSLSLLPSAFSSQTTTATNKSEYHDGVVARGTGEVKFSTYSDANCSIIPNDDAKDITLKVDECSVTPDGSVSELVCYEDRIEYNNHVHDYDCEGDVKPNVLMVGLCQEFPGPVQTWKLIDKETYDC